MRRVSRRRLGCAPRSPASLCAFCVRRDPSTTDSQKLSVSAVPQPKHIPFWVSHTITLFSAIYLLSERGKSENNSCQLQQADLVSNRKSGKTRNFLATLLIWLWLLPISFESVEIQNSIYMCGLSTPRPTVLHGKYRFCLSLTSKRDCFPFKQYRA